MREIKFRAWDKHKEKMYVPKSLIQPFGIHSLEAGYLDPSGYPKTRIDTVLMQYTGLKDENGVEIYDRDILKYRAYSGGGWDKEFSVNFVKWGETGDSDDWTHTLHEEWTVGRNSLVEVSDGNRSGYYPEDYSRCFVIGNIYENPELLEE